MQWRVIKIGAEMFDMLHAAGLAILLAKATGEPVELVDQGYCYDLSTPVARVPQASVELLDELLVLPQPDKKLPETIKHPPEQKNTVAEKPPDLPLANFDGLLTTLFTSPGGHFLSVADVLQKQQSDQAAPAQAIGKVTKAFQSWKDATFQVWKREQKSTQSWFERLLLDYDPQNPAMPLPANAGAHDLSLVMTLDPTFSYSVHRPRSDGLVTQKTNLTIHGTRFAVLLALVGAARLLRAQRLSHGMVNCYVPLAAHSCFHAETALPPLPFKSSSPEQALLLQWLAYARAQQQAEKEHVLWKGLAYQTIQTQGVQQSLSGQHGCLDLRWPLKITKTERGTLLSLWQSMLWTRPSDRPYELDTLFEALEDRQLSAWMAHLLEIARCLHAKEEALPRPYRWKEVKAMTDLMYTPPTPTLFQTILKRTEGGTLRVGRALRLLGRANRAALRDLVEELESVQTDDQLTHALALTVQECVYLEGKTPFVIIPGEEDMTYLFEDVKQSDPHTIASFLILLSALRYPEEDGKHAKQQPMHMSTCTV